MTAPPGLHAAFLRYFHEVALHGSIRKAATALNVASSAINRQILKTEDELGVKLFDRLPGGVRLTAAGEVLLRHVRDTLGNYDRALGEIDGLRGIQSGHVSIAALDSLLVDVLPRVLGDFARRHPAVTFAVQATAPLAATAAVIAGQAELALTFVGPSRPSLDLLRAVRMPIGAVMSSRHRLARRPAVAFEDLAGEPVLLQQETPPLVPFLDDAFAAFRSSATVRFVSNSIEMLRHVLRAGLGIAFFTRLGFLRDIEAGDLVWIPVASPRLQRLQLGLFVPARRSLSPASRAVAADLVTALQELERSA
jgi:DNA-binding transcriptional LysR family regulator